MAANNQPIDLPVEELDLIWQEMQEALDEIAEHEEPQHVPDPQEHEAFVNAMADVLLHNFHQANPDWNPLDNLIIVNDEEDEDDEDDEEDEELERELERRRKKIIDACMSCRVEAWKSPGGHGDDPPSSASAPLLVF